MNTDIRIELEMALEDADVPKKSWKRYGLNELGQVTYTASPEFSTAADFEMQAKGMLQIEAALKRIQR